MDEIIEKYALKNAVEHDGRAEAKAIFSKVVQEEPSVRESVAFAMKRIQEIVDQVNRLDISSQKVRLLKIDPHILDKKEVSKKELKLPNVKGNVTMRYAPNPNASMHIGNARVAILNDYFVQKYGGTFILRYDDTDPKNENKRPVKEAYTQLQKDLDWLRVYVHKESRASARLDRYYHVMAGLLKKNRAYVCTCDAAEWRERRGAGVACPCRMQSIYENERKWSLMLSAELKEGHAVVRIKTDMKYKDPAQRDWVAFRIIDKPNHAMTKNKFTVWPLLDFASAIDDHDFGVTHILRGQDLAISTLRQKWVYTYLGWDYPTTITLGHMGFVGPGTFSKSLIREGIEKGIYTGWDDPQLPMIASYERRGFHPNAIRKLIIDAGVTGGKISLSEEMLAAHDKDLIDSETKRYFFVKDQTRAKVEGLEDISEVTIQNHPTNEALGSRKVNVASTLYLNREDLANIKKSKKTRLMNIGNVVKKDAKTLAIKGDISVLHNLQKIQWVNHEGKKCVVLMADGTTIEGIAELAAAKEKIGTTLQFVRFGFVRLDKKTPLTFVYAHN